MPTTVRVPIHLHTPRVSSGAGNVFWTVVGLTAYDLGHWQFLKADGKLYGQVAVPKNLSATPNAKIVLAFGANATSGAVRWQVSTKSVADGASMNPSSLTAETAQNITVPGTARLRKDVTFPASGNLAETIAADRILIVEIYRNGSNAGDTCSANAELYGAWLQCDVG